MGCLDLFQGLLYLSRAPSESAELLELLTFHDVRLSIRDQEHDRLQMQQKIKQNCNTLKQFVGTACPQ
jgi:hypothetical protein